MDDIKNFDRLTKSTIYLFVNCCVERSRFRVVKQVIEQLKKQQLENRVSIESDLIVFDNGSTVQGVSELLVDNFATVYKSSKNLGYWSAINWFLTILSKKQHDIKYIHIIESDHFYYDLMKIRECEQALDQNVDLGAVRMLEYNVEDANLYDKTLGLSNGRSYAWCSHVNSATGEPVKFDRIGETNVHRSNFLTCLHSLNRLDVMTSVFAELAKCKEFKEKNFQHLYHAKYPTIGQHNGGVFHGKLGFYMTEDAPIAGSWLEPEIASEAGYFTTREDAIREYVVGDIVNLK
jgi:hypothetical protein